jgi:hypothetical protein
MTESKTFKRRVRERMSKTSESYTSARSQVADKRDRNEAAKKRLAQAADDRVSDEQIKEKTGKTWNQWFSLLDRWGAKEKTHTEIARYLTEDKDVPGWWAQTVTVFYERSRGLRLKHQQKDGFSISASKTVAVPVDVLYDAFVETRERKKWLPDASMSLRTSQPGRTARFNWDDGSTRIVVGFEAKGPSKSMIGLAHEKLPDADEAESMKAMWREALVDLKSHLES